MLQIQGEKGGQGMCHMWGQFVQSFLGKKLKSDLIANLGMGEKLILKWALKKTLYEVMGRIDLAWDACHW